MRHETQTPRARHVTESKLLSFVRGQLTDSGRADVAEHLDHCIACRILAGRLTHAEATEPDDSAIARLTASASIPEVVRDALVATRMGPAAIAVGDVWRVGRDEAQLVWVRRTLEDSAAVISVTLDVDLADEYTLIIPAEESPLSLDLALMTTVEGLVDRRSFLQRIGTLQVGEQITKLRQARRDGLPAPSDLPTGPPISRDDDQRLEYRQLLADLLADLSPGAFSNEDPTEPSDDGVDLQRLADEVNGLKWRRPGIQVRWLDITHTVVDAAHEMLIAGLIQDLDAAVLITVLTGADPASILASPGVAGACGALLAKYPEADDVAIAIADEEWTAVVVTPAFAERAVEVPSGGLSEPRVAFQPLPLLDALLKHLDAHATRWDETERVRFDRDPIDVPALATTVSRAAVDRTLAEGRRAVTPAKKTAYMALDDHAVAAISALIQSAVAPGTSSSDAVDAFLGRSRQ
jgi:hypothetical protein